MSMAVNCFRGSHVVETVCISIEIAYQLKMQRTEICMKREKLYSKCDLLVGIIARRPCYTTFG